MSLLSETNPKSPETGVKDDPNSGESEPRKFSEKIASLSQNPRHRGAFFTEDATAKDLALVTAKYKDIKVYWLVDPQSDLIYDAKFFSYGGPISIAMGEILSSLVKGMKIDTACDITIEEVEILLRDQPELSATVQPKEEAFVNLPMLLATAKETFPSAKALALASLQLKKSTDLSKPRRTAYENLTEADEVWLKKSKEEQLLLIEQVLDRDIRPGLNMDGGDLNVVELEEGTKLKVRYQGACGSCGSSVGATLSFIEDSMRRQLFGGFQVVPVDIPNSFDYMSPP